MFNYDVKSLINAYNKLPIHKQATECMIIVADGCFRTM